MKQRFTVHVLVLLVLLVQPLTPLAVPPNIVYAAGETPLSNASSPLVTPTDDETGQAVHPSIVYFPENWHGYQYWMAMTPYANANPAVENPHILASHDGAVWEVPPGLTNPISLPGTSYLADTDLFYDSASDQLWVYYVNQSVGAGYGQTNIIRKASSDGVNWGAETIVFTVPDTMLVSPTILKVGSTYWMWSVNAGVGSNGCGSGSTTVEYRTSSDGVNWNAPTQANFNITGFTPWHIEIIWVPEKSEFWMVAPAYPVGFNEEISNCGNTDLFFAKSTDGINWTTYPRMALPRAVNDAAWDRGQIYRSSMLYDSSTDMLRVWYSSSDYDGHVWYIGYTQSNYTEFFNSLTNPAIVPIITGQKTLSINENSSLTLAMSDLVVTDPNGAYPSGFAAIILNGSNYTHLDFTITPDAYFNGTLTVPVLVFSRQSTSAVYNLSVTVNPVNYAPVVTAPANQSNSEGSSITPLTVTASDPDGDALSFSASGLPAGLSINPSTGVISGTITDGAADTSPYSVTVTATETSGATPLSGSASFTWTVTHMNHPPSITSPGNQTSSENSNPSLQMAASDPEGNPFTWSASGLPTGLGINSTSGLISGSLDYNSAGVYTPTITATDSFYAPGSISFQWTVNNVNRAPTVTAPANQSNNEGSSITPLTVTASDPDGDALSFSASGLPAGLSVNPTTGVISGTITDGAADSSPYSVTVTVTETSGATPLSGSASFTWTVTHMNHPPSITSPGNQTSSENSSPSLQITASDPDGNPITWSASGLPAGLSINTSGLISGSLNYSSAEVYTPTITATDSLLASGSISFQWTVTNVNRAPTLTAPANQNNNEGTSPSLQVTASDPDNETLTWSTTGLPASLSINSSGLISGTLDYTAAGTYNPVIRVTDPYTAYKEVTFQWVVADVNRPPTVTSPGNQTSNENSSPSLQITASDPDGGALTWSATELPAGLSISTSGLISGNLNYFSAGTSHPTITVRDPGGLTASTTFQWIVNNVNREPVFTQPDNQTSNEGSSPGLQLIANDPDGETLTWEYINLPPGLNMNSTGYISGTLNYVSANVYNPTVKVTDPHGAFKIVSFQWTVLNVNPYPTLTQPPDKISDEGSSPTLQVEAVDPEGGALTYSASNLPTGLNINSSSGLISGSLNYQTGGVYHPTVRVTEPGGLYVEDTFTWTVSEVNPSPIMDQPITQNANEGNSPSLQITGSDPEGGALTWSATNLPPGLSINSSGLITGYLNYKSAGTYYPTIQVSEPGGLIRTVTFTWIVANVNLSPTLTRPANQTSGEGTTISLQVSASEPDDETLTWTVSGLPVGLSINASGLISGNLNYTTAGEYDPIITVTDPGDLYKTVTFHWKVTEVNPPPVLTPPQDQTSAEGTNPTLNLEAIDPEGGTLTWVAEGLPTGLSINSTGKISGALHYSSAGVYKPTIRVTEPGGLTATNTFEWVVTNVNRVPKLTKPLNQTSDENTAVSLQVSAHDPDGSLLMWTATGLPPGLSIDSNGLISGNLGYDSAGVYTPTIKVADPGELSVEIPFAWTVNNVNRKPTLFAPSNQLSAERANISLQITASDPDGDNLTWTASGLPAGLTIDSTGKISGKLEYNSSGVYNPIIRVTDAGGPLIEITFQWTVTKNLIYFPLLAQ